MTVSAPLPVHPFLDGSPKRLLIGGEWVESASGETFESINPSDGSVLATIYEGDAPDVDKAVGAARAAFEGEWRRLTPTDRGRTMLRIAQVIDAHWEELRMLDILDMGSPIGKDINLAKGRVLDVFEYFAGWPTKIHGQTLPNSLANGSYFTYGIREPVGVVGSIIPWNGPLFTATWKIAPALASGCTMVLKPAEEASLSLLRLGELLTEEADLPPGVFNIIAGHGETAGAALVAHMDVDKVSFTGSTAVGQEIMRRASGNLKRLSLELGGKSPDIVFADADLDLAIPGAAMAVFSNSGQVCVAGSRMFVERSVYDEVVAGVAKVANDLNVGKSTSPHTQIGPLVSARQLERVSGYLDAGREGGARLVAGGSRLTDPERENGYFIAPTVFAEVDDDMKIAREEIFGPVASILPFDSIEEVVTRGNQLSYGLAGGVWTQDVGKAHRLAHALRAGTVWVNCYGLYDPALPFGGYKMSGWGKELGEEALNDYLAWKSVCIRTG